MSINKRFIAKRNENCDKAVQAHAGYVNFVLGKVKKVGIQKVLKQGMFGDDNTYIWLKKAFERILDFAEEVQLKRIPQQIKGEGFESHKTFNLIFPDGFKSEHGNKRFQPETLPSGVHSLESAPPGDI